MDISICIATYRRPQRLRSLLNDLAHQQLLPREIIVVDNDPASSGYAPVQEARAARFPVPIQYDIQPIKNVAITRNRTVELARGEWLAFIDDDERAPPEWLARLADTGTRFHADGVLAPVEPVLPQDAPAWLKRGEFYNWPRMPTGTVVPRTLLRFGNLLLSGALLRSQARIFDPAYGQTGGEDGDLLTRLEQGGARMVWCDEAVVHEPVELARLSLRWLLLRSMRGGQDFARHILAGRYSPVTIVHRTQLFTRALLQMLVAGALAFLCLPFGLHRAAHWLTKTSANFGKLSAFLGLHYREYA